MEAYCFQSYADALEVIPTTLAENAGLNPIAIVTELRNRHAMGERTAGINVRKVRLPFHSHFRFRLVDAPLVVLILGVRSVGTDLQHIRGRRRPTALSHNKRDRAGDGDRRTASQGR